MAVKTTVAPYKSLKVYSDSSIPQSAPKKSRALEGCTRSPPAEQPAPFPWQGTLPRAAGEPHTSLPPPTVAPRGFEVHFHISSLLIHHSRASCVVCRGQELAEQGLQDLFLWPEMGGIYIGSAFFFCSIEICVWRTDRDP